MRVVDVGPAPEIAAGRAVQVRVEGTAVAVFRTAGGLRAVDDRCPHAGAPLHAGICRDGVITCREKVIYSIVHAGTRELTLTVPEGVSVLDVRCRYLHDWRVEGNKLKLQLEREVKV